MTNPSRPSLVLAEENGRSVSLRNSAAMISFVVGSRSLAFPYAALYHCLWQGPSALTAQECLTLHFGMATVRLFGRSLSTLERLIEHGEVATVAQLQPEQVLTAKGPRVDAIEVAFNVSGAGPSASTPDRLSGGWAY